MKRSHVPWLAAVLAFAAGLILPPPGLAVQAAPPAPPPLTLGVFPFRPPLELEKIFAPLASEIGRALGRPVVFKSAGSFETFMERLSRREYDIAHIQPFDYVRIAQAAGYVPVADRGERLLGSFYVPEQSALRGIADLRGRSVALPPEVAAISILAKIALLDAGLEPGRDVGFTHVREHHSCLQKVAIGQAAACATGPGAVRSYELETGLRFRPLERFPDAPYTVFVVHSRLGERERAAITRAILDTTLAGVPDTLRATIVGQGTRPFVPISDADFDVVRGYWRRVQGLK